MRKIILLFLTLALFSLTGCKNNEEIIVRNVNEISTNIMEDSFLVKVTYYKGTGILKRALSEYSVGSGVLLFADSAFYYILTNKHVVLPHNKDYDSYEIGLTDYRDYTYQADIFYQETDIDLIVLRFKRDLNRSYEQNVFLSKEKPRVNDLVYSVGMPYGMHNALTIGYYYQTTELTNEFNEKGIYFVHSARLHQGNSGGMLLNNKLELIGINTLSVNDDSLGAAIPNDLIYAFLVRSSLIIEEEGV